MTKRLLVANLLQRLGGLRVSRTLNRELIYIFNHHRIRPHGETLRTRFDEGVFGVDTEELRQQVELLSRHTRPIDEAELIALLEGRGGGKGPYSLVTFDDGYRDNYELAMPVLAAVGMPAIFFVPISAIDERRLGWWDQLAFVVKHARRQKVEWRGSRYDLSSESDVLIRQLLKLAKADQRAQAAGLVEELAVALDSIAPTTADMDGELMSWDQLRSALRSGFGVGSHTCRHLVLTTLPEDQQASEIVDSRLLLEQRLGAPVHSLAYPVGGFANFDRTSLDLAERAGYAMAFSYQTGVARQGHLHRFAIPRLATPRSMETFRAIVNFPRLMCYDLAKIRGMRRMKRMYGQA